MPSRHHVPQVLLLALLALLNARCDTSPATLASDAGADSEPADDGGDLPDQDTGPAPGPLDRVVGQTTFLSADARSGYDGRFDGAEEPEDTGVPVLVDPWIAGPANLSQLLPGGLLLNLNAWSGLDVIDTNDVSRPVRVGHLDVAGRPVALERWGERAIILAGESISTVDLSDPAHPRLLDRLELPAHPWLWHVEEWAEGPLLDVVAVDVEGGPGVVVVGVAVDADGHLRPTATLAVGDHTTSVGLTGSLMTVVQTVPDENRSDVSIFGFNRIEGSPAKISTIEVRGYVMDASMVDVRGDVLRVVSRDVHTNHLETFDITHPTSPQPVAHATFADGRALFAARFVDHGLFALSDRTADPAWVFEITDDGAVIERPAFAVEGWNTWLQPVLDGARLIGVGPIDRDHLGLSLYGIDDLSRLDSLLARTSVAPAWTWMSRRADHQDLSILERAVSAPGADGTLETELLVLPFEVWDADTSAYTTGVQLLTFSPSSLTARGTLEAPGPMRQSLRLADGVVANLSDTDLALVDPDPAAPAALGRLELAPATPDFFVFGEFGVRVTLPSWYDPWYHQNTRLAPTRLEVVPLGGDPRWATPIATVEVDGRTQLFRSGDLLVGVVATPTRDDDDLPIDHTDVTIYDFTDPTHPVRRGVLSTDDLQFDRGDHDTRLCAGCLWPHPWSVSPETVAVGHTLVFTRRRRQSESVGVVNTCTLYPQNDAADPTSRWVGQITCTQYSGRPGSFCMGRLRLCQRSGGDRDAIWSCAVVDPDTVPTRRACSHHEVHRYHSTFELDVLDLSDPDAPVVSAHLDMADADEAVSLHAEGDRLHIAFKRVEALPDDLHPYVRYMLQTLDLRDPASPHLADPINIAGEPVAIEGERLITRDVHWGEGGVETTVNHLRLAEGVATLVATHRFEELDIDAVLEDGAGHILVTHRVPFEVAWQSPLVDHEDQPLILTLLDAANLQPLAELSVHGAASLRAAAVGLAAFDLPTGLLPADTLDPTSIHTLGLVPTEGWPWRVTPVGEALVVPAGRYGLRTVARGDAGGEGP